MTDTTAPRTAAGKRLADAIGEVGDGLSPAAWDTLVDPDAAVLRIEREAIEPLLALVRAAERLSDKRTADSDGFWVSQREMRYLDDALGALDPAIVAAARKPE